MFPILLITNSKEIRIIASRKDSRTKNTSPPAVVFAKETFKGQHGSPLQPGRLRHGSRKKPEGREKQLTLAPLAVVSSLNSSTSSLFALSGFKVGGSKKRTQIGADRLVFTSQQQQLQQKRTFRPNERAYLWMWPLTSGAGTNQKSERAGCVGSIGSCWLD